MFVNSCKSATQKTSDKFCSEFNAYMKIRHSSKQIMKYREKIVSKSEQSFIVVKKIRRKYLNSCLPTNILKDGFINIHLRRLKDEYMTLNKDLQELSLVWRFDLIFKNRQWLLEITLLKILIETIESVHIFNQPICTASKA